MKFLASPEGGVFRGLLVLAMGAVMLSDAKTTGWACAYALQIVLGAGLAAMHLSQRKRS